MAIIILALLTSIIIVDRYMGNKINIILKFFNQTFVQNKIPIIILFILLALGLILYKFIDSTEEFGLNFTTELLGVIITVILIDSIIRHNENNHQVPIKLAAYEDVRLYASRYLIFWTNAYRISVPEPDPATEEEFFSENGMTKIWFYLNLDSEPNVTPKRNWWQNLKENAEEFQKGGDKILDRYKHILDPKVFGCVHHITESNLNKILIMLPAMSGIINKQGKGTLSILNNYCIKPSDEDFEAILTLLNWCRDSYNMLKVHNTHLKEVSKYIPKTKVEELPKCMIDLFLLLKYLEDCCNKE